MPDADLIPEVRRFIIEYVNSVDQLETLLLLYAQQGKPWTAALVSAELRTSVESAALRLSELKAIGVTSEVSSGQYQYSPSNSILAGTIDALSSSYKERRVSIITLIYNKPVRDAQAFSDAFRFKKTEGP